MRAVGGQVVAGPARDEREGQRRAQRGQGQGGAEQPAHLRRRRRVRRLGASAWGKLDGGSPPRQTTGVAATLPGRWLRRRDPHPVAALRNRFETTAELTEQLGIARHRARTVWGLLTRAATILAPTLFRLGLG